MQTRCNAPTLCDQSLHGAMSGSNVASSTCSMSAYVTDKRSAPTEFSSSCSSGAKRRSFSTPTTRRQLARSRLCVSPPGPGPRRHAARPTRPPPNAPGPTSTTVACDKSPGKLCTMRSGDGTQGGLGCSAPARGPASERLDRLSADSARSFATAAAAQRDSMSARNGDVRRRNETVRARARAREARPIAAPPASAP